MELKMNPVTLPEKISFNFLEIKEELKGKLEQYTGLVYTEEQIKEAKADRAALNKLKKALNDERIKQEKEYMAPFVEFKAQINELISLISEPVNLIDKQVKEFEELQRQNKANALEEFWEELEKPFPVKFAAVLTPKWLAPYTSLKKAKEDMEEIAKKFFQDLDTLKLLPNFSFEAIETYKKTLDLNQAIEEGKRLEEIQARKQQAEAQKKAETQKKSEEEVAGQLSFANATEFASYCAPPKPADPVPIIPPVQEEKQWVSFQALLSTADALALKDFFNSRNINFKPI